MASISQSAAEEALIKVDRRIAGTWPVAFLPYVTSPFGWRPDPFQLEVEKAHRRKLYHNGLDFRAATGEPVRSVWPGVVFRTWTDDRNGQAIRVLHLAHPEIVSGYAHLDEILVAPGEIVAAGQHIGRSGSTGKIAGAHLHFCVSVDRQWVDPLAALENRWSVDEFAEHLAAGDHHPKV